MKKCFLVFLTLLFLFSMIIPVFSSENESPSLEINIEIENDIIGDEPLVCECFVYELISLDDEYPLPENTIISIDGEGCAVYEDFLYTHAGVYQYEIHQLCNDTEGYEYDDTVYELTVYITNDNEGGFESTVNVFEDDTDLKSANISFVNTYTDYTDLDDTDVPQTGDVSNVNYMVFFILLSFVAIVVLAKRKNSKLIK